MDRDLPFPPGRYPAVVVGSGPGGLQVSSCLAELRIEHALISADDQPGGMFRRFPLFQRLISWSKPYAPVERGSRAYERYDWNSLLAPDRERQALVADFMDGTSYFPSRHEMERGLSAFAERGGIRVRWGCRWESTSMEGEDFVLHTSGGDYACKVAVFATGMTEPWKPAIPGIEQVPHYVQTSPAASYAGKRVFVVGKRNSAFEIADGLLPWARQLILASPRPAEVSLVTRAPAARYLQPYEDHLLGGGTAVLDAAIERVEPHDGGFRVFTQCSQSPKPLVLDVDSVIAATGFSTPLLDLPSLGVATFMQGRLPAQTPFWESPSLPRIYFAGSVTQGSIGLKKYGIASRSSVVHGFRYNARILAGHIARTHFGHQPAPRLLKPGEVVDFLVAEAAEAPELWNQKAYLARVVTFDPAVGIVDEGILPLAHFVDSSGPPAIALSIESDATGDTHPALYMRHAGKVDEHLLDSDLLLNFSTGEHRARMASLVSQML